MIRSHSTGHGPRDGGRGRAWLVPLTLLTIAASHGHAQVENPSPMEEAALQAIATGEVDPVVALLNETARAEGPDSRAHFDRMMEAEDRLRRFGGARLAVETARRLVETWPEAREPRHLHAWFLFELKWLTRAEEVLEAGLDDPAFARAVAPTRVALARAAFESEEVVSRVEAIEAPPEDLRELATRHREILDQRARARTRQWWTLGAGMLLLLAPLVFALVGARRRRVTRPEGRRAG